MAGQIHKIIQHILTDGAKNDPAKVSYIKTKLILKGIDPEK
jgi:hypothetical protein